MLLPSWKSQVLLGTLRANRFWTERISLGMMHADAPPDQVARMPMLGTKGTPLNIGSIPAILVSPSQVADSSFIILHMHGGAYVSGGLLQARVLASHIAAASGIKVITFAYRLAPQHPYPAQLEDAQAVYAYLLSEGYNPRRIAFTGESAGGNLALALALKMKADGMQLPAGILLLSPWGDPLQTGESYRTLENEDPTLDRETLMTSALQFAGGDRELLSTPMLSPIHADFRGFPPVQIHVGTKELLLSDAETLAAAFKRDEVPVSLLRWEGMCHVFQVFGFQESRLSIKAAGCFLRQLLISEKAPETLLC